MYRFKTNFGRIYKIVMATFSIRGKGAGNRGIRLAFHYILFYIYLNCIWCLLLLIQKNVNNSQHMQNTLLFMRLCWAFIEGQREDRFGEQLVYEWKSESVFSISFHFRVWVESLHQNSWKPQLPKLWCIF